MLNGKKTYIIGIALLLWAIGGAVVNKHTWDTAIQEGLIALGMMGIRNGIPKKI